MLIEAGLPDIPVLYLSPIIAHRQDHYRTLLAVSAEGAWEAWILYMLAATEQTARWTTARIGAIRDLLQSTAETVRTRAPEIYIRGLVELVFVQSYCRVSDVVDAGIARRQSASGYLKTLVDIGVLKERKAGREKLFVDPALLRTVSDR